MKVTLYVGWKPSPFYGLELTVWNTNYVSEKNGYSGIHTIDVEIPADWQPSHEEVVAAEVKELRTKQGVLQAEMIKLEGQIQNLLCIEHQGE